MSLESLSSGEKFVPRYLKFLQKEKNWFSSISMSAVSFSVDFCPGAGMCIASVLDGSLVLRSPQCTVSPNLRKCVVMRADAVCRSCRFRKMKAASST